MDLGQVVEDLGQEGELVLVAEDGLDDQLRRSVGPEPARARGGEVWYLAAKDEGHGFKKKSNRDFYQKTIVTFLEKQLTAK